MTALKPADSTMRARTTGRRTTSPDESPRRTSHPTGTATSEPRRGRDLLSRLPRLFGRAFDGAARSARDAVMWIVTYADGLPQDPSRDLERRQRTSAGRLRT